MHPTDGNLHALERHLAEIEANTVERIGLMSFQGGGTDSSPRIHTPKPFRDILIAMARSVKQPT